MNASNVRLPLTRRRAAHACTRYSCFVKSDYGIDTIFIFDKVLGTFEIKTNETNVPSSRPRFFI